MKHPEPIEEILHQCLQRLDAGEDIASCLRDYPEHHDVLAPLLAVTADVRRLPAPTLPAHVRSAARLRAREVLVRQATAGKQQNIPYRLTMLQRRAVATLLALVLVIGSLGATVAVAQQSLPGDVLYRVKRGSEQLRVQLTPALEERAILYLAAADRRVAEALALLARGSIPSPETIRDIALAYGRAKDAIAQMRPTDQVSFVERYNQLVDQHAHEIGTTLETTTLPNVRDVLQEIRQATVSTGPVAPSMLPSATPSISPTAGDVVPIYTASAVVRETATAVPSTPTQTSARTTTVPVVTPTQSEDASTPSTPSATRGTDRPGTEPPASTSGSRPLQTVTSLPVPSPEPTVSATTPPPTQPSESGTPTVPATPSPEPTVSATTPPPTQPSESGTPTVPVTPRPSDEPSPTSTSGG